MAAPIARKRRWAIVLGGMISPSIMTTVGAAPSYQNPSEDPDFERDLVRDLADDHHLRVSIWQDHLAVPAAQASSESIGPSDVRSSASSSKVFRQQKRSEDDGKRALSEIAATASERSGISDLDHRASEDSGDLDDLDDSLPSYLVSHRPEDTADRDIDWSSLTSSATKLLPHSTPHVPLPTRTLTNFDDTSDHVISLAKPTPFAHAALAAASLAARDMYLNVSASVTRVPAGFQSSLVSTWTPRDRSPWFQKKAIIITSIFLAILIVLTIGAAVFLRDRKLDDLIDDDDDDEAAIERMVQERLQAGMKNKEKKLRRKGGGDEDEGEKGVVGVAGLRGVMGRMNLRRRRRNNTTGVVPTVADDGADNEVAQDRPSSSPRPSLDAVSTRSVRSTDQDDGGSQHRSERRQRTAMRWVRVAVPVSSPRRRGENRTPSARSLSDPDHRRSPPPPLSDTASATDAEGALRSTNSSAAPSSDPSSSHRGVPLNAADFGAADEIEARDAQARSADDDAAAAADAVHTAVPPAYQNRTTVDAERRVLGEPSAGRTAEDLNQDGAYEPPPPHPQHAMLGSVRRPLAGEEEDQAAAAAAMARALSEGSASASDEKGALARREMEAEEEARGGSEEAIDTPAMRSILDPAAAAGSRALPLARAHEAHVATDDKTVLSALAAARGAPPSAPHGTGTSDEMVPIYAEREGETASAPTTEQQHVSPTASASASAPSAPPVLVDQDGFELLEAEETAHSSPASASSALRPSSSGSTHSSNGFSALPAPPAPHISSLDPKVLENARQVLLPTHMNTAAVMSDLRDISAPEGQGAATKVATAVGKAKARGPQRAVQAPSSPFDEPYSVRPSVPSAPSAPQSHSSAPIADESTTALDTEALHQSQARRDEKAAEAAQEREMLPSAPPMSAGSLPAYEQQEQRERVGSAPSAPVLDDEEQGSEGAGREEQGVV